MDWNLKKATHEANAKHGRMENEKLVREFVGIYTGGNSQGMSTAGYIGVILLIIFLVAAVGYSICRVALVFDPNLFSSITVTNTPCACQTFTPVAITAAPTNIVSTTVPAGTPVAITAVPTNIVSTAIPQPPPANVNPMPFGGVYNPVQIPSELAVPEFNGTLSATPQRLICGYSGKVEFEFRPPWTKLYVLTTVDPAGTWVRMPSSLGGPVTIFCPPTRETLYYIYGAQ